MNFLTYWQRLREFLFRIIYERRFAHQPKISLLIPFSTKSKKRGEEFKWLLNYWKHELPYAEVVVGRSRSEPFCKGEALNDAARRATGKVLVILDADAYLYGSVIESCADRILEEMNSHLWYVPYRHLYRLNKEISGKIIKSDPKNPLRLPSPPPSEYVVGDGLQSKYGHRYGAMIMIFPREALDAVGRYFDERFKGWGGEDIALLRALDTLYGKHKTTDNDVLHLWHPVIGDSYKTRVWKGQDKGQANKKLSNRYNRATRNPSKMREMVEEGCKVRDRK